MQRLSLLTLIAVLSPSLAYADTEAGTTLQQGIVYRLTEAQKLSIAEPKKQTETKHATPERDFADHPNKAGRIAGGAYNVVTALAADGAKRSSCAAQGRGYFGSACGGRDSYAGNLDVVSPRR